jgi:hypothetical protein
MGRAYRRRADRTVLPITKGADALNSMGKPRQINSRCVIFIAAHTVAIRLRTLRLALHRTLYAVAAILLSPAGGIAQQLASPIGAPVPHRYLVVYRDISIPSDAAARIAGPSYGLSTLGVRIIRVHPSAGIAVVQTSPYMDDVSTIAALRAQPGVEYVVHDRVVSTHRLFVRPVLPATVGVVVAGPAPPTTQPVPPVVPP